MAPKPKYYFCTILLFTIALTTFSQNVSNNATVTIIGDPVSETPVNTSGSGGNPYINASTPPANDQQLATPQNIDPTFENGFHIRYDVVESQQVEERPSSTGYEYASITSGGSSSTGVKSVKKKRVMTMTERSFNLKKRFKAWMPKRKKKYRPNVCGRF